MSVNENGNNQEAPQVNPTDPLLSIRNLRVWFELRRWGFGHAGYVHAVDNVSFDLQAGGAIGIVGESGCGKTTLMKTILGLY
ncbi:MAG: ATP-binding cassette domain-containing protein, partial [Ardenticatenales bacterium]|nr:ATP-binding cassette domain-containing protein [Ardenticatenales bacterium]